MIRVILVRHGKTERNRVVPESCIDINEIR